MKMKLPYEGKVYISSPFGLRTVNGEQNLHRGIDIVGKSNKRILAPCDGIIKTSMIITDHSNRTWEWGNFVRLDTEDGLRVFMCHMSRRCVKAGDAVKAGELIGYEGNTGYSFGSHCHFEVRRGDISLNPCQFLSIENEAGKTYINTFKEDDMTGDQILKAIGDVEVKEYNDLPAWAKPLMRELLDKGIVNGGTTVEDNPDDINLYLSDIKVLHIIKRMIEAYK